MIGQYLSNINESATIFILQKSLELNKAILVSSVHQHVLTLNDVTLLHNKFILLTSVM